MFEKARDRPNGAAQIAQAEVELAKETGVAIAELFFSHEVKRENRK